MFTTLTLIGRSIYGLASEVVWLISVNNSTCPPAHDHLFRKLTHSHYRITVLMQSHELILFFFVSSTYFWQHLNCLAGWIAIFTTVIMAWQDYSWKLCRKKGQTIFAWIDFENLEKGMTKSLIGKACNGGWNYCNALNGEGGGVET